MLINSKEPLPGPARRKKYKMTTAYQLPARSTNTFAIAALVFAILQPAVPPPVHVVHIAYASVAIVVSIVCGFIALRQINGIRQGRELAVLAVAISALRIQLSVSKLALHLLNEWHIHLLVH
jgi:hypothetical protein